ncbi:MAG TPA: SLBB domain-containing protein [Burkholderiales bacterium]|nr:SLBB domain-containing protein [Burkholderiales bacterium]
MFDRFEISAERAVRAAWRASAWTLLATLLAAPAWAQTQGNEMRIDSLTQQPATTLPIQSPTIVSPQPPAATDKIFYQQGQPGQQLSPERQLAAQPPKPVPLERNEFQEFVLKSTGRDLPLFGYNLFEGAPSTFAPLDRVPVPSDYVVGPGDEIMVRAWGQIDVDVRTTVDRNGRIYIPKVGAIEVAATRYQDLDDRIRSAIKRVFKNFDLVVTLGELRSIQVFVVGQARKPGTYTVSSLSTLVNAVFASGGPNSKGSMRRVQLKRGNRVVTEFDFYDLLVKGDKSKDASLLPGDVIFIPSIGPLAALSGSVNNPAIYELKGKENLADLIAMAGGLSTSAAGQKVTIERIYERKTRVVEELALDQTGLARAMADGDIVNVFTLSPRIVNAVTLRGNVATPMRFEWKQGLRVSDIIPDRSFLVSPDYWMQRNRAGRPKSWLIEDEEAKTDVSGRRTDIAQFRAQEQAQEATGTPTERRDATRIRRDVKRPGAEVNWDYAVIERLNPADFSTILLPFNLGRAIEEKAGDQDLTLEPGDIVTVFSKDDIQGPAEKQSKFVRLEGEFQAAGVYQIRAGETLRELLARVGGFTPNAYLYGAEFTRETTRVQQQERLDEALGRLEVEMQRAGIRRAQGVVAPEDAQSLAAQTQAQQQLLAKLKQLKAKGRIVLGVKPASTAIKDLPNLVLEDGDRLYVPPRPSTVSVFGSVYNQNSYVFRAGRRVTDYLDLAGGPTVDADKSSLYVLRADGSVISKQQSGWLGGFGGETVYAGDAVIVPEDLEKIQWTKELRDWTQIFYQFALGVVGLDVLRNLH